jgi:hypothetical protein
MFGGTFLLPNLVCCLTWKSLKKGKSPNCPSDAMFRLLVRKIGARIIVRNGYDCQ